MADVTPEIAATPRRSSVTAQQESTRTSQSHLTGAAQQQHQNANGATASPAQLGLQSQENSNSSTADSPQQSTGHPPPQKHRATLVVPPERSAPLDSAPSEPVLAKGERRLIAEDPSWNLSAVKSLATLCVCVLVANFEKCPVLAPLPPKHRNTLLGQLSPDISLSIAAPIIPEDTLLPTPDTPSLGSFTQGTKPAFGTPVAGYWQRRARATFTPAECAPSEHGNSWRRLYFELFLQRELEGIVPPSGGGVLGDGISPGQGTNAPTTPIILPALKLIENIQKAAGNGSSPSVSTPTSAGLGRYGSTKQTLSDRPSASVPAFPPHLIASLTGEPLAPNNLTLSELADLMRIASPFVRVLRLQQLRPAPASNLPYRNPIPVSPGVLTDSGIPFADRHVEGDHFDLGELLGPGGTVNLRKLEVYFGMRDVAMGFSWKLFGMTQNDCLRLCRALEWQANQYQQLLSKFPQPSLTKPLPDTFVHCLEELSITRAGIDDDKCRLLCRALAGGPMKRLDLSHNRIGSAGARAIAHLLAYPPKLDKDVTTTATFIPGVALTHLILANNHIETTGAQAIGRALWWNKTLVHLSLRLNEIGDAGGVEIVRGLARQSTAATSHIPSPGARPSGNCTVYSLDLASTSAGSDTATAVGEALVRNCAGALGVVDMSCNKFGLMQQRESITAAPSEAPTATQSTVDLPDLPPLPIALSDIKSRMNSVAPSRAASVLSVGSIQGGDEMSKVDVVGKILLEGVRANKFITRLDVRATDLNTEFQLAIQAAIEKNSTRIAV
ncbi:hypothetical protein M427DRAFT_244998 [Gonapodya prolifera JEL478]|uniref:RNI-like protein n=1 Tax=Gonapodya prolifera (strain JEL478) TaxID=1344416 RepID=A0A139AMF1_GONPJ|nr:hypothetical protein M427DRAFT_244998 [Gonapodya prolifera JEL478]|eukprot:KXS17744.1 hypothetical protein M427DRAFT_244998 [Gonapodya prolifera JEL478]